MRDEYFVSEPSASKTDVASAAFGVAGKPLVVKADFLASLFVYWQKHLNAHVALPNCLQVHVKIQKHSASWSYALQLLAWWFDLFLEWTKMWKHFDILGSPFSTSSDIFCMCNHPLLLHRKISCPQISQQHFLVHLEHWHQNKAPGSSKSPLFYLRLSLEHPN